MIQRLLLNHISHLWKKLDGAIDQIPATLNSSMGSGTFEVSLASSISGHFGQASGALWPPTESPRLRVRKGQFKPSSATYICVILTDSQPPCVLLSPIWYTCPSNLTGKLWQESIPKDWQGSSNRMDRQLTSQNNSYVVFLSHQSRLEQEEKGSRRNMPREKKLKWRFTWHEWS